MSTVASGLVTAVAHRVADKIIENWTSWARSPRTEADLPATSTVKFAQRGCPRKWPGIRALRRRRSRRCRPVRAEHEAVGLDTRQAHQVLDDPQHAPSLVADSAARKSRAPHRQVASPRRAFPHSQGQSTAAFVVRDWRSRRNRRASSQRKRHRSDQSSGPAPRSAKSSQ